ncbi:Aste57867_2654 [Aphanomyces stellatus]|uniref:Aste57867_2654 protein n=1 Tax=Aphanomyces stellatus TaxID=120398 RepID=A0A485K957_9STRA|nr:hypothetical protein As57867_002647 [Aphanomyces stellatus]VFT79848.1 Aste57867_2654 [Aphanomyces stellatus]
MDFEENSLSVLSMTILFWESLHVNGDDGVDHEGALAIIQSLCDRTIPFECLMLRVQSLDGAPFLTELENQRAGHRATTSGPRCMFETSRTGDVADVIRSIAHVFPTLHVHNSFDLALVRRCTGGGTIAWHGDYLSMGTSSSDWLDDSATLHVVEIDQSSETPSYMASFVSTLSLLVSPVRTFSLSWSLLESEDALFEYIRDSSVTSLTLSSLYVYDEEYENVQCWAIDNYPLVGLADDNFEHFLAWLTREPVTRLVLDEVFIPFNVDARQRLYQALFYTPTLRQVRFSRANFVGLASIDFSLPLQMSTLNLTATQLTSADMEALCRGLVHSNVRSLNLSENKFEPPSEKRPKPNPWQPSTTPTNEASPRTGNLSASPAADKAPAKLLAVTPHLQVLNLNGNVMSFKGTEEILRSLITRQEKFKHLLVQSGRLTKIQELRDISRHSEKIAKCDIFQWQTKPMGY